MLSSRVPKLIDTISQVFFGLRFRLLLLVLLACAPLVGLALHTASKARRNDVASWCERSRQLASIAQREEKEMLRQAQQLLLALSESSSVRSGNRQACNTSLGETFASYPSYANVGVIDTDGEVRASVLPSVESDLQIIPRVLETRAFAVGEYPTGFTNDKPTVTLGNPVFDGSGHVRAAVFVSMGLDWFAGSDSALSAPEV